MTSKRFGSWSSKDSRKLAGFTKQDLVNPRTEDSYFGLHLKIYFIDLACVFYIAEGLYCYSCLLFMYCNIIINGK